MAAIETPRFHWVDGPAEGTLRDAVLQSDLLLPLSYKDPQPEDREFYGEFGNL
jgi:hypothetical protein